MNSASLVDEVIANRRSVFPQHYSGERVDDEVVKKMLANANWAPTHKLTEPWRFIVYTGEGLKKLGEIQAAVYKEVTERDGTFKEERYNNLLTKPQQSSHIIVIIMKRDDKKSVPEQEEMGAVFCAVQNMHLTAAAYNVGAYLSTGGVTYFEEAKQAFGLSEDDRLLGFFNIGMPKNTTLRGTRKPIEEKVTWVDR